MKIICFILIIIAALTFQLSAAHACFGDKLGIGYVKGGVEDEFAAHLIAIYIKEKTGIDSLVNEFKSAASIEGSMKKGETDIIVWRGSAAGLDTDRLAAEKTWGRFFPLVETGGGKVVFEVSKKLLEDIEFFTLNKVMERAGRLISPADFTKAISLIKDGEKFSKQAAREYLLAKDLI